MEYQRRLPHFQPEGRALFITFRLYGTMPLRHGSDGRSFVLADRELERTAVGPRYLKRPEIAECVADVIREGANVRGLYDLIAYVVMSNHVHLLLHPVAPVRKITQYLKGVSALRANRLLGRTGRFWQVESFDRWVRSTRERKNIIRYIEFNPVCANIVVVPESFRYSSAFESSETRKQTG